MKIRNIFIALFAMATLASCSEDEIMTFDSQPALNMGLVDVIKPQISSDTARVMSFGFLAPTVTDSTMLIRFKLQGVPVNYDRTVQLIFEGDAKKDTHFTMVNSVTIKAGEIQSDVPIKLFRADTEIEKSVIIRLAATSELIPGIVSKIRITISDVVPSQWINELYGMFGTSTFGPCTKAKYRVFFGVMGFYDLKPITMGDYGKIKVYLNYIVSDYNANPAKYNNQYGPAPLMDDDGVTPLKFGA